MSYAEQMLSGWGGKKERGCGGGGSSFPGWGNVPSNYQGYQDSYRRQPQPSQYPSMGYQGYGGGGGAYNSNPTGVYGGRSPYGYGTDTTWGNSGSSIRETLTSLLGGNYGGQEDTTGFNEPMAYENPPMSGYGGSDYGARTGYGYEPETNYGAYGTDGPSAYGYPQEYDNGGTGYGAYEGYGGSSDAQETSGSGGISALEIPGLNTEVFRDIMEGS